MAHDHDDRSRHPGHDRTADAPLWALAVALAINTGFPVVEFAGALYADSLTLLADAVHMLADGTSPDAVVSRCQSKSGRKFDIDHATVQVESESYSHVTEFDCYESDGKP